MPNGYTASQSADGTWNVLDVPVFGPLPAGVRKAGGKPNPAIGREWMEAAVKLSAKGEATNYRGPFHVRHTGDDQPKIPAGQFVLRRVGKYQARDGEVDAIFADLVNVPPAMYEALKKGALPYRSVEVFDWDKPEINALAALDTDVPFHRFGWDGIGREIPAAERTPLRAEGPLATQFAAVGAGGIACFAFEEKKDDAKEGKAPCTGAAHFGAHCSGCTEYQDENKETRPVTDKDTDKDPGAAQMKALTDDVAKLRAEKDDLAAKLSAAEKENGATIARCAALEQKDKERDIAARVVTLVAKARNELRGYNFSAKVEARFAKLAAIPEAATAESEVADFIALCKESMVPYPPATFSAAVGREGVESDPPELLAAVTQLETQGIGRLAALEIGRDSVAAFHAHSTRPGSSLKLNDFLAADLPVRVEKLAMKAGR